MTLSAGGWRVLGEAIDGEVLMPDSPWFAAAYRPAIPNFTDVRPHAIVRCATPADVAEAIRFAVAAGLPRAVRGGGHCFAGSSSTEGVLIDVTPMNAVSMSGTIATLGAGTRIGTMYDALARHGVTLPTGCGDTVSVAGMTLGGGLGILGRLHGLTCDHLVGAEVVLSDGRVVECSEDRHEDLLWALRGAGHGTVGVVTSLTFRTVAAPAMTGFHLMWPAHHAATIINEWQHWAPLAPVELAASLVVSAGGDVERPPVVSLAGAMTGTEADCVALLAEFSLRCGADPRVAIYRPGSHREVKRYLVEDLDVHDASDSAEPVGAMLSKCEFFAHPLPYEVVTALVDHLTADRVPGQSRELDFTPLGGAYNRLSSDATAFVHRTDQFLLKYAVMGATPIPTPGRHWLRQSWELAHPWGTGRAYPNFRDPDLDDPGIAYYGCNYARLRKVQQTYDPDGFFARA